MHNHPQATLFKLSRPQPTHVPCLTRCFSYILSLIANSCPSWIITCCIMCRCVLLGLICVMHVLSILRCDDHNIPTRPSLPSVCVHGLHNRNLLFPPPSPELLSTYVIFSCTHYVIICMVSYVHNSLIFLHVRNHGNNFCTLDDKI